MTFPEPNFQRVPRTGFYWLNGSGRTIGFQATSSTALGDTPSLSKTWSGDPGGLYLFLGVTPASDAAFAAALLPYLRAQGWPGGPRFLWLENPNLFSTSWVGQTLSLTQSGTTWSVSRRADFRLINYTLTVTGESTVTLATEAQGWGFALAGVGTTPVGSFFAPGGQYTLNDSQLLLPFAGAQAGCWRCSITLPNGSHPTPDFVRLGVGIRYFYPEGPYVRAIHLPVIRQPATGTLKLDVALDPLHAVEPERSWLSFFPLNPTLPALDSTFSTARGYDVTLTPLAASGSTPDARLVFAQQPRFAGSGGNVPKDYYLSLQGAFAVGWHAREEAPATADTTGSTHYRLLCGASGLEYLGMPTEQRSQLYFIPGKAAYASPGGASSTDSTLSDVGTTSWLWASTASPAKVRYYAQPEDAPLYQAPSASGPSKDTGSVFLDFLEVPALELAPPNNTRCFPAAPYRGLAANEIKAALALEAAALAPVRRQALLDADPSRWAPKQRAEGAPADTTSVIGVTPQGLAVGIGGDGMEWTWVGIANDTDTTAARPNLLFTQADGAFRQALETNRLFMVAANDAVFMRSASVKYQLTAEGIAELRAGQTVPATLLDEVSTWFAAQGYPTYDTEARFVSALRTASPGAAQYALAFERKSGLLTPRIGDWHFQLSPRTWDNPQRKERKNTLVVFKFTLGRSLQELSEDVSSWTWPDVAALPGGTVADAQKELRSIYLAARKSLTDTSTSGKQSPYANFIRVLDDPNWTGIIAFSCSMELSALPDALQALAAGIDADRFFAHHVGVDITPFSAAPGVLSFGKSSMFGLLDYQDPADQYFESNISYAFKVLQLTVGFRNSVMTDFSSRVELLVNQLFGTRARLYPSDHGNNVLLDGVYQRQRDANNIEHGSYVFSMERQNTVGLENSALRWVRLLSAQLVTVQPANLANPSSKVVALFQLGGNLSFYEPAGFDPFSFGETRQEEAAGTPAAQFASALRFGNLAVRMEFTMAERKPSFSFVTETLSFDLANSQARDKSLYKLFPLKLSGFIATPAPLPVTPPPPPESAGSVQKPESLGYVSVGAPIQQSTMKDPWYGLVYDIDLGTLGALAGSAGLTLNVIAAWSSGGTREEPAVYVGVKLPGLEDALGVELPLQGVITLGFKSIQFLVAEDEKTQKRQYMLRFRNFAFQFLGISFPPGHNDILLAGNPDAMSPTKLGWYAAYSADDDEKKKGQPSKTTRLVAARRLPSSLLTPRRRR